MFQKKIMDVLAALNRVVLFIERLILIILMVGMLILGFLQVFSRFVLKAPISWSEELLTYSFIWASFIGAAMAIYTRSHFSIDLLIKKMSFEMAKLINIVIWLIVCIFSLFLFLMGWRLAAINSIQMMNVLPISMLWAYMAISVSGLFMFIHSIEVSAEFILNLDKSDEKKAASGLVSDMDEGRIQL